MKTISAIDCLPLLAALKKGVVSEGILKAFIEFGEKDSSPISMSAKSIAMNLKDAKDFQSSIQNASPRLPSEIELLFIYGAKNSVFDYLIDEILAILNDGGKSEEISTKLDFLIAKYEKMSNSIICDGCFERDFAHLLARAKTEQAEEVILEQEGDNFFHQKFISSRVVHVIDPYHSLVIKTYRHMLESNFTKNSELKIFDEYFQIKKTDGSSFSLWKGTKPVLKIVFK